MRIQEAITGDLKPKTLPIFHEEREKTTSTSVSVPKGDEPVSESEVMDTINTPGITLDADWRRNFKSFD